MPYWTKVDRLPIPPLIEYFWSDITQIFCDGGERFPRGMDSCHMLSMMTSRPIAISATKAALTVVNTSQRFRVEQWEKRWPTNLRHWQI